MTFATAAGVKGKKADAGNGSGDVTRVTGTSHPPSPVPRRSLNPNLPYAIAEQI